MKLLCYLVFAQISFEWKPPVTLEAPMTSMDRITITDDRVLVRNESQGVVHMLDKAGRQVANLGEKDVTVSVPFQASWNHQDQRFYLYDAGARNFSVWDKSGAYQETKATDFDYFFEVYEMAAVKGGYIAPISLTADNYLLALFDKDFQKLKYDYRLVDPELRDMSTDLRRTFVAQVGNGNRSMILAIQKLARDVIVFDDDLNQMRTIPLSSKGWKVAKMSRLKKISKNPKLLRQYRKNYTNIASLEGMYDSFFIVGIRNLKDTDIYTYQCYDASRGLPVTNSFDTPYRLVGAWKDTLYFVNPGASVW